MPNLADYIVSILVEHGVKNVYGYPGAAVIPLMDAIERNPEIRWVLMRHEGSASLAAAAEAKQTSSLSVCLATSGPGATNLTTGLLDARSDQASVLALTGMLPTWRRGRGEFQDFDQLSFFSSFLSHSSDCSHPDQLPPLLRETIGRATTRNDCVHLGIPVDIQALEIET